MNVFSCHCICYNFLFLFGAQCIVVYYTRVLYYTILFCLLIRCVLCIGLYFKTLWWSFLLYFCGGLIDYHYYALWSLSYTNVMLRFGSHDFTGGYIITIVLCLWHLLVLRGRSKDSQIVPKSRFYQLFITY